LNTDSLQQRKSKLDETSYRKMAYSKSKVTIWCLPRMWNLAVQVQREASSVEAIPLGL